MADTLDRIKKLVALAMNNPDIEESRSAALRAVAMIVEHNIPIGGQGGQQAQHYEPIHAKTTWKPDDEFEEFVRHATKTDTDGVDPDLGYSGVGGGTGLKAAHVDTDLDDDFMRKRIKIAWKALTRERARLKREIEEEYCKRFQKPYPRPNPVDWEKP